MSTCRANRSPRIAPLLARSGAFASEPLTVLDVGASGGIDDIWRNFDPSLDAYGFDPLLNEVKRLNEGAAPGMRYFDAFIGWEGYEAVCPAAQMQDPIASCSNSATPRTSASRASQLAGWNQDKVLHNANDEMVMSQNRYSLDDFAYRQNLSCVDVIKVDTDGFDFEVLLGAKNLLEQGGVLGVLVESQFQGPIHPYANTFSNIDRYLRDLGFSLFDLDVWRYSRAALPRKFVFDMPGPTHQGQVLWADALYLKDVGDPDFSAKWGVWPSPVKLLKAIALFELFGLGDCAAETIKTHAQALNEAFGFEAAHLLNLLPPVVENMILSYESYVHLTDELMRQQAWRSIP
ncbi:MAG: FkbM family methyltransferase [Alphaproteobacteria bacterium]|nr:FkbM family methyltransferase [Alphaproteobacteria bacterium]